MFDLLFEWDMKAYQMKIMKKWCENVVETRRRDNVTPRRGGDVPLGVSVDVVETY